MKNERQMFQELMKLTPEQSTLYPSKHIFIARINQTFKSTKFIDNLLSQLKLQNTGDAIFINNNEKSFELCKYLKNYIIFGYFDNVDQIQSVITKYGLIDNNPITNNNIVEQKYNGEILSIGEMAQYIFDGDCKDVNIGFTIKINNDTINNQINSKKEGQIIGDLENRIYEYI